MTDLRKRILTNIYKKEEAKIDNKIEKEANDLKELIKYYDYQEKRLNLCLKNKLNTDIEKIEEIEELKRQYQLLKEDKSLVNLLDISLLTFAHLLIIFPYAEIKMLSYCLTNILNNYKEYALANYGIKYSSKKYKLVKKNLKKELKANFNDFDEQRIRLLLNHIQNERNINVEKSNDKIDNLYCEYEKLGAQLFNCKMLYIDGKFKPLFSDGYSAFIYNDGKKPKLLPSIEGKAKIKTLKNTIKIK